MILKWFRKQPNAADQLKDFIERLSDSRAEDLGLAVATVEHTANTIFLYTETFMNQKKLLLIARI